MTERVLIVGLGKVGVGYDVGTSVKSSVFSHSRAFSTHPGFSLVGGVDPSASARAVFEGLYSAPSFDNLEHAISDLRPSVVVVANPTEVHAATARKIIEGNSIRAILCEKPIAFSFLEAASVVELAEKKGCSFFVNYMRRSEPGVNLVRQMFHDGTIQGPVKGHVWYSKGLYTNGSHCLNLLEYWLGPPTGFTILRSGRLWNSRDPEPDFVVTFGESHFVFSALKEEHFFHLSVEIMAENGRLEYQRGGAQITWQPAGGSKVHAGYRNVDPEGTPLPNDFLRVQAHVVDALAKKLRGVDAPICTGREGLETLKNCQEIERLRS